MKETESHQYPYLFCVKRRINPKGYQDNPQKRRQRNHVSENLRVCVSRPVGRHDGQFFQLFPPQRRHAVFQPFQKASDHQSFTPGFLSTKQKIPAAPGRFKF
jgi:hypothetical protein